MKIACYATTKLLFSCKLDEYGLLRDHLASMIKLFFLEELGSPMNAQASHTVLVRSLPPWYSEYVQNPNLIGSNISIEELTEKLIIADAKIKNYMNVD